MMKGVPFGNEEKYKQTIQDVSETTNQKTYTNLIRMIYAGR